MIYFFLLNLIIIVIKKLSNPWVQPDPCGLGWTYVMSWVRLNFFLTHHGGFGQKIPLTQPMHTRKTKGVNKLAYMLNDASLSTIMLYEGSRLVSIRIGLAEYP